MCEFGMHPISLVLIKLLMEHSTGFCPLLTIKVAEVNGRHLLVSAGIESTLIMVSVCLGVSSRSVAITPLIQWMLPRAVLLGWVMVCFVVFLVQLLFWISSRPSPMSSSSSCKLLPGSNSKAESDDAIVGGTWHLIQTTWPAGMIVFCLPVCRCPHCTVGL